MKKTKTSWLAALKLIESRAERVDVAAAWPADNMADLKRCGALTWAIPRPFGGTGMDAVLLHRRYEELARRCLTTALILTQRDSAVGFLLSAAEAPASTPLLRSMARGTVFATIGIAQLTTSGRHLPPAVVAHRTSDGFRVSGRIPWVTGAAQAQRIIVGAATSDGRQILFALLARQPRVVVEIRKDMVALNASCTGAVQLRHVFVPDADVLVPPCNNALELRSRHRSFGLSTCVLPLGVAAGALSMAEDLVKTRFHTCRGAITTLRREYNHLAAQVYKVGANARLLQQPGIGAQLRAAGNDLAARSSLAALELSKGHGFMCASPAQRRAREALFFFVWSSPTAVIEQTLTLLAGRGR
ncbi:MAG: acyl-CoA/acyl-ACP dehydrogenase [Phycisphaerae bacterium]|nr:acyl-CoA/acyl-ACP dehydrogenase [Phycisphaerae bacterium]